MKNKRMWLLLMILGFLFAPMQVMAEEDCQHSWVFVQVSKAPTYTETGISLYYCSLCNTTKTETIDKLICSHKNTETRNVITATENSEGYSGNVYCKDCSALISVGTTIPKVKSTASETSDDADETEDEDINTNLDTSVGKVKITSLKQQKSKGSVKFRVRYKISGKKHGYQIQYATNKKFTKGKKTVKVFSALSYTSDNLKKKTYYVRVRAYRTVNRVVYYGKWSNVKKITLK